MIILDEADTMTAEAQAALRRIMETYAKVTRFCLICNYVTRVIEPLASRCAKFRFRPLPEASMVERLSVIAQSESVPLENGALDAILRASNGDMRKAVTYLQCAHQLIVEGEAVRPQLIVEIAGEVSSTLTNPSVICLANGLFLLDS